MTPRSALAPHELDRSGRRVVLAICCMSLFIVGLDVSALNVALPDIGRDLDAPFSHLQWTIDAYALTLAGLLMLSGSIADRVGRRRIFRIGLMVFGAGSLLCAVAPTSELLIAARVLQAVGGSMLNPVAMSIITNTFHDAKERAAAIGAWGAAIGLSMALGPVIGGVLVAGFGWRAIFLINVPVVVAALVLMTLYVPESRAETPRRLDPVGQALVIVMLVSLTFGIIEGREIGWGTATVIGCFVLSAVAVVAFVAFERRTETPLISPVFFSSIPFSSAVVSAVIGFASIGGFLLLNTLYLQDVRGYSALHAGLLTLPMAVTTAVLSPISGRLVGSIGPRVPMVLAGLGVATSGAILTRLQPDTSTAVLVAAYVAFGVGFGLLNAPITNAAVSGMPRAQAGTAAAVASTSRQIGSALGVAVLGAIAYGRLDGSMTEGFAQATHAAWAVMAALGLVLVGLGFVATSARAARSVERVRSRLD
ncbi:MAG: EmrB/QacA subfamily drug resistance transporter [Aeromicrobium sp.]|jgi:EmrB/QacA subfamily drug resistance transporter|nr:EmrB/QacA subfamily drug resistance transporter [Aeromicrobium sp.]